ncbi:MAG: hypothetical protein J5J06_20485 [Phycisphaerae bacterium]|nr:hypothetical protein [Phycisphaerae bacterium]
MARNVDFPGVVRFCISSVAILSVAASAAPNLVPNADFENYTVCPTSCSQVGGFVDDWSTPTNGTSDYFNACQGPPNFCDVPTNNFGAEAAFSGQAYAGFFAWDNFDPTYREYIEVQLSSPLAAATTYQISFYVSLCDNCDTAVAELAAYVQAGPVGYQPITTPIAVTPQVVNNSGPITLKNGWQLVSGTFVAAGGEDHLVIGNFNGASNTTTQNVGGGQPGISWGYYFVDEVDLSAVDPPMCAPSPDGLFCEGNCGTPDQFCSPREILADANGHFVGITCCQCAPTGCHVAYEPATLQIYCENDCGAAGSCTLVGRGNLDGTISYICDCQDPANPGTCDWIHECNTECNPGTCSSHCTGPCPAQSDACVPQSVTTSLQLGTTTAICDCVEPAADPCRVEMGPDGAACQGTCPAGSGPCELVTVTNPDDSTTYSCTCDAGPAACEPDPTGQSCTGGCQDPADTCYPKEIVADEFGNFVAISCCDCGTPECHVEFNPATNTIGCVEPCGDPTKECTLVGKGNLDGTITYACECLGASDPAECTFISECNPCLAGTCTAHCSGPCPPPYDACVPDKIFQDANNNLSAECLCDEVGDMECRPVVDPLTQAVTCVGGCQAGIPCPQPQMSGDPTTGIITYTCPPCGSDILGACCIANGPGGNSFCVQLTQVQCEQIPGLYLGDNVLCEDVECPPPTGACCLRDLCDGPSCVVLTLDECENQGGSYIGHNIACTPDPCQEGTGACCVPDGFGGSSCQILTATQCNELFGYYGGDDSVCNPDPCTDPAPSCGTADCCQRPPRFNDPLYAGFTGPVAVATGTDFASSGQERLWILDVKNKASAPLNTHWSGAARYSHPSWNATNLGNVFGVALDRQGNIYVTASTSYYSDTFGAGGPGAVYKIDAVTAAISTFAVLPNTGPGLGNIAYDCANRQFFVTNFEDGKIYRLNAAGSILSTFDPGTADNGAAGYAPLGERLWGVDVHGGRVYYGVWAEDGGWGRYSTSTFNTIWSVALVGGNFSGAPQLEVTIPDLATYDYSNPPSDLAFSTDGCMLIGERSMYDNTSPSAHLSEVLEYRFNGSSWVPSGHTFDIGFLFGSIVSNAAGGVDYETDGTVWATGDALQYGPQYIYGLQNTPGQGGGAFNSVLIDLNGNYLSSDKMQIGDVEIPCLPCVKPPTNLAAWWPLDETTGPTANEVSNNLDGTHTNGPQPLPGRVANALRFDGVNDTVLVPDNNLLDFTTSCAFFFQNCVPQDLSIDAWIRTCESTGTRPMVNKWGVSSFWFWTFANGYDFSLNNGVLQLTLADQALFFGGGVTSFLDSSATNVADGQWHHVAVTVDRDQPNGGTLYIDGTAVSTFNPTPRYLGLANGSSLRIGDRTLPSPALFDGDIDEVQIFRRAITGAEVFNIYRAWNAGKCKDKCHNPNGVSYCVNQSTKVAYLTLCNDSTSTHSYNWSLAGLPASPPDCTIAGPTVFSPSSGSVSLAAGQCTTFSVTITAPPGLTPGQTACYALNSTNIDTGHSFQCAGKLYRANLWCGIKRNDLPDIITARAAQPFELAFSLTNESDGDGQLDYAIRVVEVAEDSTDHPAPAPVSLNGLPPGEPVIGTLSLAVGQSTPVSVSANILGNVGRTLYDAQLAFVDSAGARRAGGVPEVVESVGIRQIEGTLPINPPLDGPSPHDAPKNRYLAFVPNNGASEVAFRLVLSGPNGGALGWIDTPDADGIARVSDAAVVRIWDEPIVFVADCEIATDHGYEISTSADGQIFSDALYLRTVPQPSGGRFWGDVVGTFDSGAGAWTPPNGTVNGFDITAVLKKFAQDPNAPHISWVDVNPQVPDEVANGLDILQVVNAFSLKPYPFAAPENCP